MPPAVRRQYGTRRDYPPMEGWGREGGVVIQIIGYMVAAYGVARLIQTSLEAEEAPTKNRSAKTFIGVVGAGALALLAILLTNQANEVGSVLP